MNLNFYVLDIHWKFQALESTQMYNSELSKQKPANEFTVTIKRVVSHDNEALDYNIVTFNFFINGEKHFE